MCSLQCENHSMTEAWEVFVCFFFYPIKEEIPQTSDCRDILSLSKDWACEFLLGKRSASPALTGLSSLRIGGAVKANPSPEALRGQLPPGRLGIPWGWRADVEQCLAKSLAQTLLEPLENLPLSLEELSRFRGEKEAVLVPSWAGSGAGGEQRAPRPSPPSTAQQPAMLHCNLFHLIPWNCWMERDNILVFIIIF